MPFDIKAQRSSIERDAIGFAPNTSSVKPVHIANGLFRGLLGGTYDTRRLFQFVFIEKSDGAVLPGHDVTTVYNNLRDQGLLNTRDISEINLGQLRRMLRKVLTADGAVSTTGMESYSAGSQRFVANDRIAQDGGEFLASWMQSRVPELATAIVAALAREDDVISVLSKPLLSKAGENHHIAGLTTTPALTAALDPLTTAARRLAIHLAGHPNKLTQLRFVVLFGSFALLRYLADLERTLTPELDTPRPVILLDLIDDPRHPIRLASQRSYILALQALTRAYTTMFTTYLKRTGTTLEELALDVPTYGPEPPMSDPPSPALRKAQRLAAQRAAAWGRATDSTQAASSDPFEEYGQAIYDILASDADAVPYKYFRALGLRAGLLQPVGNAQPTKHFAPRQDMLEVLVRGVVAGRTHAGDGAAQDADVEPAIDLPTLLNRMWTEYGIVVGGRPEDEEILYKVGITQADTTALDENREAFARQLQGLSFARLLADGVLEVTMEG